MSSDIASPSQLQHHDLSGVRVPGHQGLAGPYAPGDVRPPHPGSSRSASSPPGKVTPKKRRPWTPPAWGSEACSAGAFSGREKGLAICHEGVLYYCKP